MSDSSSQQEKDQQALEVARRERRKRINQAFREGNLALCLEEITRGLSDEPEESTLIKALGLVQGRYIGELVEPLIADGKIEEAEKALMSLQKSGTLSQELREAIKATREHLEQQRPKPPVPEEELDVSEKVMRKAEKAWAAGNRKETKQILRSLHELPLDDHDVVLRRDGLRRLVEQEDKKGGSRGGEHHFSALRWMLLLVIILALAAGVFWITSTPSGRSMVGLVTEDADRPGIAAQSQSDTRQVAETRSDVGWIWIETGRVLAEVRDEAGLAVGSTMEAIQVPSVVVTLEVGAEGYFDTVITCEIAQEETTVISLELRKLPPVEGFLTVFSEPQGAEATLEGLRNLGVTPLQRMALQPGNYKLKLTANGMVPFREDVGIESERLTTVTAKLKRWNNVGKFQLNSVPWAFVFVNGDSLGPTPLTTARLATNVYHDLLFRTAGGIEVRKRLMLDPGRAEPTPVTMTFPKPGLLAISTTDFLTGQPIWAPVWNGERKLGDSPGEFMVSPGVISLRVVKPGYSPAESTVTIAPGSRKVLNFALVPEGS